MPPFLSGALPGDARFWQNLRDGRLHIPLRVGFVCEVIKEHTDKKTKLTYKIGMVGQVFAFNDISASVGFQGLDYKVTVPFDILKGGPVKWNTWTVQGHDIDFKIMPRGHHDINMDTQFPRAVHALMSALHGSDFPTIGGYYAIVGDNGEQIDAIKARIVVGTQKAGLLDTLNSAKFTVQDIERNASLKIGNDKPSKRTGIYLRIYKNASGQVVNIETYIGKSKNYAKRFYSVVGPAGKKNEKKHWNLNNDPNVTATWVALCILDDMPDGVLHIAEQVFVSLLETYAPEILTGVKEGKYQAWLEGMVSNASYMVAAADVAKERSRWPGATISRPQEYGSAKGMNLQSPLFEINKDRTQLIRVDSWRYMPETNEMVQIANFRRAIPRMTTWADQPKSKGEQVISWMHFNFPDEDGNNIRWSPTSVEKNRVVDDGFEVPGRNVIYGTVFEVRLDGKPHPKSFFRGPGVPVFLNSNIADSWALRIEWTDPNDKPKARYIQPSGTKLGHDLQGAARGQSRHFLKCIAMIHHLFGCDVKEPRDVYFKMGTANVLQAHYDYLLQEITFDHQKPYPNDINYGRISDRQQMHLMQLAGLQNINVTFANRPKGKRGLAKCDSCMLEGEADVNDHLSCLQKSGVATQVCEHCYDDYGRAACSFTPHQRWRGHNDPVYVNRFRPVLHAPALAMATTITSDVDLELIPSIPLDDDEVSDGELVG